MEPLLLNIQFSDKMAIKTTVHSATMAMIAGYLVFLVREKFSCESCISRISTVASPSPLLGLIKNTDRGGRLYPKPGFINVWLQVEKATESALPYFVKKPLIVKNLSNLILPYLEKNNYMTCKDSSDEHDKKISLLLLKKFLRPYITNTVSSRTEKLQMDNLTKKSKKELNKRKLFKVTS